MKAALFGFNFQSFQNWTELDQLILHPKPDHSDHLTTLITPNVDQVVRYEEYPDLNPLRNSFIILPDGLPIVWIARLKGKMLKRNTGADYLKHYLDHKIYASQKVLFILPSEAVRARLKVTHDEPNMIVAPHFPKDNITAQREQMQAFIKTFDARQYNHILIGLGFPTQERLALTLLEDLKQQAFTPIIMLLGASFEFYTGSKRRAPIWIQKIGLEWFYRMMSEPERLFKRYLYSNTILLRRESMNFLFNVNCITELIFLITKTDE